MSHEPKDFPDDERRDHRAVGASTAAEAAGSLNALRDALRLFAAERDWEQFHTPKNLAIALSVEASELLERFQWLTAEQSTALDDEALARVREEMADVLLYLVRLADRLGVDLLAAARDKLVLNAQKYPVDRARGNSRKYTEL
jgi:NTP pyrophosphatase (non-canonical NTP hydrolase)